MVLALATVAAFASSDIRIAADGSAPIPPVNDAPNPYTTIKDYFTLPAGRTWGSTSAVEIDKDGKSIWIAERCGANSCADPATGAMSPLDPALKFDASGTLVTSFRACIIAFAPGLYGDPDRHLPA